MTDQTHWEDVYRRKRPEEVSWFQERAALSLELIDSLDLKPDDPIIDVGGGASRLVDDLLARGFRNVSVLDLSAPALRRAQERLGERAASVDWQVADITSQTLPSQRYLLWHDRAVFHFMTTAAQREAYKATLARSLRPGGHALIATFAENGPERCSGLPVQRYGASTLAAEMGPGFQLLKSCHEAHQTPAGNEQQFVYCLFRRAPA